MYMYDKLKFRWRYVAYAAILCNAWVVMSYHENFDICLTNVFLSLLYNVDALSEGVCVYCKRKLLLIHCVAYMYSRPFLFALHSYLIAFVVRSRRSVRIKVYM